jgi:hypothetical protein
MGRPQNYKYLRTADRETPGQTIADAKGALKCCKTRQGARICFPERAVVRSQNKLSFIISVFLPLPDHPADLPREAISHL